MVHDVTVADEDVDVLECGICYRPLKPPIFQVHTTGPANLDIRAFVPASSIRFPVLYLLITVRVAMYLQCAKGHVVCSLCSDRLKDAVKCHVCRVAMPGGYQRCHAMERVVDSIRMPCPHALYGCEPVTRGLRTTPRGSTS